MLKCQDISDQTSAYLDREMGWQKQLEFRMHLLLCHHCRSFVSNFKTMLKVLNRVEPDSLSVCQHKPSSGKEGG